MAIFEKKLVQENHRVTDKPVVFRGEAIAFFEPAGTNDQFTMIRFIDGSVRTVDVKYGDLVSMMMQHGL